MSEADLVVPGRFHGPARSGNGGYTAGLLAERVAGPPGHPAVEVTLRQPPPLDVAMRVQWLAADDSRNMSGGRLLRASLGGIGIADARPVQTEPAAVDWVSMERATDAMAGFAGLVSHPFPTCFVCGPDRGPGDGLRIFPGPVGRGRVASLWVPEPGLAESSDLLDGGLERVGLATTWAALDCVGGWASDLEDRPMVLGRMTALVEALPAVGEPHVVVGAVLGEEGRKTFTASTLYDHDARVVARAEHVWIAVDPAAFR